MHVRLKQSLVAARRTDDVMPIRERFAAAIRSAGDRLPLLARAGKTRHLDRLIAAEAWTDAALALIALDCPTWSVRRIVREEGEWLCSLSRWPGLPLELDHTADGFHPELPLAILAALAEARWRLAATSANRVRSVPDAGRQHLASGGRQSV